MSKIFVATIELRVEYLIRVPDDMSDLPDDMYDELSSDFTEFLSLESPRGDITVSPYIGDSNNADVQYDLTLEDLD